MSLFSSPQEVRKVEQPAPEDPALKANREAIAAQTSAAAKVAAEKDQRRQMGRTMGTEGANAFFTSGAAGYTGSRTMGAANI